MMGYKEILENYREFKRERYNDSKITAAERKLLLEKYRSQKEAISNKNMDSIIQKYFDS